MDYNKINQKTYSRISSNWTTKREYYWEPVKEFLDRQDKSLRLLDLACGTGRHMELAKELGYENIVGCDFAKGQLAEIDGFETKLSDMLDLEFEDSKFDLIINIAAFHHLLNEKDQIRALYEMKRVLKKKGRILISVWEPGKVVMGKMVNKKKIEEIDNKIARVTYEFEGERLDRYYYFFEKQELKDLCEKVGFEIVLEEVRKGNYYLELLK